MRVNNPVNSIIFKENMKKEFVKYTIEDLVRQSPEKIAIRKCKSTKELEDLFKSWGWNIKWKSMVK
jgi:hypothetical protein